MSGDIIHSVLEGLDSSQSKGGLIIRKKPKASDADGANEQAGAEGGFKLPSGPSLLGLDKLAAVKERERKLKEAETAKKRQLEQDSASKSSIRRFVITEKAPTKGLLLVESGSTFQKLLRH